jgi:hypothetical protein
MRGDWRDFRPAIWLAMLGLAVMLLVAPFYFGALFLGAAAGTAIRIRQRQRQRGAAAPSRANGNPRDGAIREPRDRTNPKPPGGAAGKPRHRTGRGPRAGKRP